MRFDEIRFLHNALGASAPRCLRVRTACLMILESSMIYWSVTRWIRIISSFIKFIECKNEQTLALVMLFFCCWSATTTRQCFLRKWKIEKGSGFSQSCEYFPFNVLLHFFGSILVVLNISHNKRFPKSQSIRASDHYLHVMRESYVVCEGVECREAVRLERKSEQRVRKGEWLNDKYRRCITHIQCRHTRINWCSLLARAPVMRNIMLFHSNNHYLVEFRRNRNSL